MTKSEKMNARVYERERERENESTLEREITRYSRSSGRDDLGPFTTEKRDVIPVRGGRNERLLIGRKCWNLER